MSIQNKPDYKIFASGAKSGEVDTFPDILRGWGVTIDRTGEIPPMEWFNAIGKRTDEWLLYLTQRGIPEWDSSLDYPKSAVVTHGDVIYISLRASKGEQPSTTQAAWGTLVSFLGIDGKLDKTAVVQTTGQSTTNVMSQKAVTDAFLSVPKNAALKAPEGWWKCGDTGLIIQWGEARSPNKVWFPISFTSQCFSISFGQEEVAEWITSPMAARIDKDGFTFYNNGRSWNDTHNQNIIDRVFYMAIGV